ncbi:MAG: CoA-binding protein [Fidelibacterota bacterium]
MNNLATIKQIFTFKTIAVVGLSPKPERPSYRVAAYLQSVGYRIIPVNPGQDTILGEKCYASLTDIPEPVAVVDVFRRSEFVPAITEKAIAIGAKALWLQDGVIAPEAAQIAEAAGLLVVMNDCMFRRHRQLYPAPD